MRKEFNSGLGNERIFLYRSHFDDFQMKQWYWQTNGQIR
jgi:hypothetical protein